MVVVMVVRSGGDGVMMVVMVVRGGGDGCEGWW